MLWKCSLHLCIALVQIIVLEEREEFLAGLDEATLERQQRRPFAPLTLVNPVLRPVGRAGARFLEGCLSVPGYAVRLRDDRLQLISKSSS